MTTKLTTKQRRVYRVRNKIKKSGNLRLSVFRSDKHIYAQIIDDVKGETLAAASSRDKDLKLKKGWDVAAGTAVGKAIGKAALAKGLKEVVFDRGSYVYHGRVKAVAEGAREAGLKF